MDVRNAHYSEIGTIDCEINHPTLGWIPFTASPDDVEQHGRDIYAALIAGEAGEIAPFERWPDLSTGQSDLAAAVNTRRDHLETQGFPHAGLWFQSDERSVARINSTALTASSALMVGQNPPFPDWIAADNTALPVDAQGVLALQASLTTHAGALHAHARGLKTMIEAAESIADLETIDINAGWPGQQGGV
jgi:hypothetical protein